MKGGEIRSDAWPAPSPVVRDVPAAPMLASGNVLPVQQVGWVVNFCVRALVNFSMREQSGR